MIDQSPISTRGRMMKLINDDVVKMIRTKVV